VFNTGERGRKECQNTFFLPRKSESFTVYCWCRAARSRVLHRRFSVRVLRGPLGEQGCRTQRCRGNEESKGFIGPQPQPTPGAANCYMNGLATLARKLTVFDATTLLIGERSGHPRPAS